jgi:hypothetical protein
MEATSTTIGMMTLISLPYRSPNGAPMDSHFRALPRMNVFLCMKYQRYPSGMRFTVSTNRAPKPVRYPRLDMPNMQNALKKDASMLKIRTK